MRFMMICFIGISRNGLRALSRSAWETAFQMNETRPFSWAVTSARDLCGEYSRPRFGVPIHPRGKECLRSAPFIGRTRQCGSRTRQLLT